MKFGYRQTNLLCNVAYCCQKACSYSLQWGFPEMLFGNDVSTYFLHRIENNLDGTDTSADVLVNIMLGKKMQDKLGFRLHRQSLV